MLEVALDTALLHRAQALLDSDRRRLLGIVGPPGAGKSTFAESLVTAIGPQAQLLPLDGYHLSNRELRRLRRSDRKGAPDTFDAAGYLALLRRLREPRFDETIYAPGFYREIEEAIAASIAIEPEVKLVVTEGNYLLLNRPPWDGVADLLDESWYLQVPERQRYDRLIRRHRHFGRSELEARRWVATVDEPNAKCISRDRSRASAVLTWLADGNGRFELDTYS